PEKERALYQQVYFHKLGTPLEADTYVLGKDFPGIAGISLEASPDGRYLLASAVLGWTSGDCEHYLLDPSGKWTRIPRFPDHVPGAGFGPDDALYLLAHQNAPRGQVLRLPLANPDLTHARVIVPQSAAVIQNVLTTPSYLYVSALVDGLAQIRVYDRQGREAKSVPLLPNSSVEEGIHLGNDQILFSNETYFDPPPWYRYDPGNGKTPRTRLAATYPVDFRDTEFVRVFATSKDGTRVPLQILRRKGTRLDGRNPVYLTGYGGYGENLVPNFDASRRLWLEQGGVYAVAN